MNSPRSRLLLPLIITSSLTCPLSSTPGYAQTAAEWYEAGERQVMEASRRAYSNTPGAARNIILFVGDGMGVSTLTAARIFAGQQQGMRGEEYSLSFEQFPYTALAKTYNTNQQTPDSAGTMSAMVTGVKTKAGFISVDDQALRADCESYMASDNPDLVTVLELAELSGMSTGIVSTARLTHATPAATYAKTPERNWESSSNLSAADKAMGCEDIASQLISFRHRLEQNFNNGEPHPNIDGIDLAFGGGRSNFFEQDPAEFEQDPAELDGFAEAPGEGNRDDGRNLIEEWQDMGGLYVMDQAGLNAIDNQEQRNVLGLFNASHMHYEADRTNDSAGEPSLREMTMKAIELLQQNENGFFLMVEGGRIDHAHHAGNAYNALNDTVALSHAVEAATALTDPNETLIIVTADHSHVFTMAGYPTRGNPILGKVVGNDSQGEPAEDYATDIEGAPYTTLGYMNGAGFADQGLETDADTRLTAPLAGRQDLENVDTEAPGYHQESLVPMYAETHAGEDVAIFANGPGAHLLSGSLEQNVIFHVMNFAGSLTERAEAALED